MNGGGDDGFTPSVVMTPDGAWVAWRAGTHAVRARRTADPATPLHTLRIETDDRAALLGATSDMLTARTRKETVTLDLATGAVERTPVEGRPRADHLAYFQARAAADGLGVDLREVKWRAVDLDLDHARTQADAPVASADGAFAWADDDGRVWVETDDGLGPRLLTGPALTPARVSFVGESVQVGRTYAHTVATLPLDGGPATVSTEEEEARAAGAGATGPTWAGLSLGDQTYALAPPNAVSIPLPGPVKWLGSSPDGTIGAYADAAGVVYLHRAGEADPFRALLTWPEGLP